MRATVLLRRNLESLLRARGQTQHDLAQWCRRSDAWLSKILDENANRGLPLKYLDRIAEFFGIAAYQLFQPGISPLLERRQGERRSGLDRRVADPSAIFRRPGEDVRELVSMLVRASVADRQAVYAQLLAAGIGRTAAPSTTENYVAPASGPPTTRATRTPHKAR